MTEPYRFHQGAIPLLVSVPHDGRDVPDDIARRMTEEARQLPDTDWHVRRLYDFAEPLGASVVEATHSRYVVDVNRDPDGAALYPGADNTEVCPTATFDLAPIYREGEAPDEGEIQDRIEKYWRPYHRKIQEELARMHGAFGVAVLFDAHSIRSQVPRFFDGRLPDFNLGTASGASADAEVAERAFAVLDRAEGYSGVLNGRFTGGYITRHYGSPGAGIHAIQLEMSQAIYMDEAYPFEYDPGLADRLRPVLERLIGELIGWVQARL